LAFIEPKKALLLQTIRNVKKFELEIRIMMTNHCQI